MTDEVTTERSRKDQVKAISIISVIVIAVIWALVYFSTDNVIKREVRSEITSQLKNPDSAEFSGSSETTVEETGDGEWEVNGWVSSKNGFNATVKSDYTATVEKIGDEYFVDFTIATDEELNNDVDELQQQLDELEDELDDLDDY